MVRKSPDVLLILLVFVAAISAQDGPQMPKPGPEHKRLDYFAGDWLVHGEGTSGVKFTRKHHAYWLEGGFFLVSHDEWTSPAGNGAELTVMGYDPDEKAYTYYSTNSWGQQELAKGTVEGDTWTWNGESKMSGKLIKHRFIIKIVSPDSATMKFEISADGGPWTPMMELKGSRLK